jgi:hypothetical protein
MSALDRLVRVKVEHLNGSDPKGYVRPSDVFAALHGDQREAMQEVARVQILDLLDTFGLAISHADVEDTAWSIANVLCASSAEGNPTTGDDA